jgi:prevent-host-death family protein
MIDLTKDIHPLTDFKRRTTEFTERLKQTGHPLVLTVNGKPELVVHDAKSYQKLLETIERAEAIQGIRRGLDSFRAGKGAPLDTADERIRRRHGIPR